MDLQNAFYVIGIIYMSVMLALATIVLVIILNIKSKVDRFEGAVDERLDQVRKIGRQATILLGVVRHIMKRS